MGCFVCCGYLLSLHKLLSTRRENAGMDVQLVRLLLRVEFSFGMSFSPSEVEPPRKLTPARLLFSLTTAMSVYGIIYFRREGYLPGASRAPNNASLIDPDKDAFSTNPHDEYAPVHDTDDHDIQFSGGESSQLAGGLGGRPGYENSYGEAGGYEPPQGYTQDTGYGGAQSVGGIAPGVYAPPHVQDEDDAYGGNGGRVQFPDARYGNV
jgi:hypothetical protein